MSEYDHRGSPTRGSAPGHGARQPEQREARPAPGKQTLVQQLPALPPTSASSASIAPGQQTGVHAAAAHGVSGNSHPLPSADQIQRLFGHHDVGGIEAHTDAPAAAGARAMGAQAFAAGNHVAFGSAPDLHTSAHEAAHVIQQRAGVHLKGGVGEAGDVHEAHANQVADQVVAGESAEHLLDRYGKAASPDASAATVGAAAAGSPVQRQVTGTPPAPQPPSAAPARAPQVDASAGEAYHAPTSAHDPHAPPSRNADWDQVHSAATDKHTQEALDIAWIEALPTHLKDSIDEGFSDTVAVASVARTAKTDQGLKTIDRESDQQEKDLRAATIARLAATDPSIKRKHGKALEEALGADPAYLSERSRLEAARQQRKDERNEQLRVAADGPRSAGGREDTVASPTAKVTRLEGKALARTNFMSWAIDVLGSTEAAKKHFLSIRQVSRQPGMFLIDLAATRFEAARAAFEAKHPGYTFPSTDVAQSLRGFHQARQGIGMLGHALGVAFDLLANDNPNQKIAKPGGDYGYALDRFGGDGDKRGRSVMTLGPGGEDTIAQLGRDTAAHRSTPAGEAMIERIRQQFDDMVATSERFSASMEEHLPELSQARDDYFNSKETEKDLARATADEKNAEKIADKRLKDEKFTGDDAAKTARREAIKSELQRKKEQLAQALQQARDSVHEKLEHAFSVWAATINADLAAARARQATSDSEVAGQAKARQDLDAVDAHAPDAVDLLNAFADAHQLKKRTPAPRAASYKLILKTELAAAQKPRANSDPLSPAYIRNEIAVLKSWQERLHDPDFVFGKGISSPAAQTAGAPATTVSGATSSGTPAGSTATPTAGPSAATPAGAAPAKHWATQTQVTSAPLMQMIEHGFIRHDEMPARPGAKDTKQVFNAEVTTTLAAVGFSPGASYRDTMHFDFIEGYAASPGGRSQPNMNKTKYGPSGDIPAPAPKPQAPPLAKKDEK